MARLAFSLFFVCFFILLSHAHRLPPLKSSIFPSNHLTDSITHPKIHLPSAQVAGAELPGSDAVAIASDDHLQPDQLENKEVVEWKASSSNDLPDSAASELAIFPYYNQPTDLATLPSEKQGEDSVPSEIVAESEPINVDKSINKCGFHFQFDFLRVHFHFHFPSFHFHSHCHHDDEEAMEIEKKLEPRVAGEEIPYTDDMLKARTAWFPEEKSACHHRQIVDVESRMMKFEEGNMKIHKKKCKKEKEDDEDEIKMQRHKEWKKDKEDDEEEVKMKKYHKKEWKKEKEDHEDDEEMMRVEEGKMKRHKKSWKKEMDEDEGMMQLKRHKKVWKKEKEDEGLRKLFRKLFKRCRRKFYKLFS